MIDRRPPDKGTTATRDTAGTLAEDRWKRRWLAVGQRLTASEAENARLRAALDELNAEVEEFLSVAHQAGHEAAKSWLIRSQAATIRGMRASARQKAAAMSSTEHTYSMPEITEAGRLVDGLSEKARALIGTTGEEQR